MSRVDNSDESRPQWDVSGVECECGADISEWHSRAEARRLARIYGTEGSSVPKCPSCVEWRNPANKTDTVTHAVKHMQTSSSVEQQSHVEAVLDGVITDE